MHQFRETRDDRAEPGVVRIRRVGGQRERPLGRRPPGSEIVPGFFSSAVLYEPAELKGKAPAILNVNGHVGPIGKAVEYKQKRCINFAKRGMIALNLEWFGYGELAGKENDHSFAAHLDLRLCRAFFPAPSCMSRRS